MKQRIDRKTSSSGNVIRTILREELEEELKKFETRFETKMDFKLENLERRVDEKAKQYRDDVLIKMDEAIGELQTMREENTIGSHQITRLNDQVEDHEKRIKILESAQKS